MDISDVVSLLRAHAQEHELEKRAHEGFRTWVDEAAMEGASDLPAGWRYIELTAEFESMCLWIRPPVLSHPYIDTRLAIKRSGIKVGYYRLITNMEGEYEDDYFVIDGADDKSK